MTKYLLWVGVENVSFEFGFGEKLKFGVLRQQQWRVYA